MERPDFEEDAEGQGSPLRSNRIAPYSAILV